ncbi:division control 45 homolog [Octopus vulgaris]|uniref:Division control 45 homolog n=1 Tax=Octopus vulgaris TaxID=6645 RepID=A0AA36ASL3_OCTVU|nr:division control 45 homolog [Octopus vulgaris]
MLIKDPRKEIYSKFQNQHVLVLVSFNVDALCACKILQYLFQCDQVLYSIIPITGKESLETAFMDNCEGVKHIVMINCGASFDVVELLQPEKDVCFYIFDSHRPIDVHNVYNSLQVKVLVKENEITDIPDYDTIFRDDEDDMDSDGEDDETGYKQHKKQFDDKYLMKKRERRLWEENRNKTLFTYTQFSSFGTSAALLMLEMAWTMSKDTNDLIWFAVIGVTDQLLHYHISREKYIEDVMLLQSHLSRHNRRGESVEDSLPVNSLKIFFEEELQLIFYRHWSLFESICNSITTACKFKLWTMKGRKKLQEFLADMGIPLTQCQQRYNAMDPSVRNNMKELILKYVEKYGLAPEDIIIPSFNSHYGYHKKINAADVVLACSTVLENTEENNDTADSFFYAMDILQRDCLSSMEKGIELSKKQIVLIVSQVQTLLDMRQVMCAGPFLYAFIREGSSDAYKPQCLQRLARFVLEAYEAGRPSKKARYLPMILCAPYNIDQHISIVIGIPPLNLDDQRNFFGKAFEQAALATNSRILHNHFDNFILLINTEDKEKFFDALINILQ